MDATKKMDLAHRAKGANSLGALIFFAPLRERNNKLVINITLPAQKHLS